MTRVGKRVSVRSVTASHLKDYRDSLISTKKAATVEFWMSGVTGALNSAHLYFPELENYKAPTLPKLATPGRKVLVPRSELITFISYLRQPHKYLRTRSGTADVLELLQLTGARVSEICNLEPESIDFERRLFTIYGKGHRFRTLPMSDSIEAILRRRRVFPTYAAIHQLFESRIQLADSEVKVSRQNWVIHAIRHTAASVLAEAGVSHSIIAAVLGHKLGGVTAIYTMQRCRLSGMRWESSRLTGSAKPGDCTSLDSRLHVQILTGSEGN